MVLSYLKCKEVKLTSIDHNANHSLGVPHSAAPQEQVFTVESNPHFTRMLPVYKNKVSVNSFEEMFNRVYANTVLEFLINCKDMI